MLPIGSWKSQYFKQRVDTSDRRRAAIFEKRLVFADQTEVAVVDLNDGNLKTTFTEHKDEVLGVSCAQDKFGNLVVASLDRNNAFLWNWRTAQVQHHMQDERGFTCIALLDQSTIAIATEDDVQVWRKGSNTPCSIPVPRVTHLAWSKSGEFLAASTCDGQIRCLQFPKAPWRSGGAELTPNWPNCAWSCSNETQHVNVGMDMHGLYFVNENSYLVLAGPFPQICFFLITRHSRDNVQKELLRVYYPGDGADSIMCSTHDGEFNMLSIEGKGPDGANKSGIVAINEMRIKPEAPTGKQLQIRQVFQVSLPFLTWTQKPLPEYYLNSLYATIDPATISETEQEFLVDYHLLKPDVFDELLGHGPAIVIPVAFLPSFGKDLPLELMMAFHHEAGSGIMNLNFVTKHEDVVLLRHPPLAPDQEVAELAKDITLAPKDSLKFMPKPTGWEYTDDLEEMSKIMEQRPPKKKKFKERPIPEAKYTKQFDAPACAAIYPDVIPPNGQVYQNMVADFKAQDAWHIMDAQTDGERRNPGDLQDMRPVVETPPETKIEVNTKLNPPDLEERNKRFETNRMTGQSYISEAQEKGKWDRFSKSWTQHWSRDAMESWDPKLASTMIEFPTKNDLHPTHWMYNDYCMQSPYNPFCNQIRSPYRRRGPRKIIQVRAAQPKQKITEAWKEVKHQENERRPEDRKARIKKESKRIASKLEASALRILHDQASRKCVQYLNKLYDKAVAAVCKAEGRPDVTNFGTFDFYEAMNAHIALRDKADQFCQESMAKQPQFLDLDAMYFCYEAPPPENWIPLFYHYDCPGKQAAQARERQEALARKARGEETSGDEQMHLIAGEASAASMPNLMDYNFPSSKKSPRSGSKSPRVRTPSSGVRASTPQGSPNSTNEPLAAAQLAHAQRHHPPPQSTIVDSAEMAAVRESASREQEEAEAAAASVREARAEAHRAHTVTFDKKKTMRIEKEQAEQATKAAQEARMLELRAELDLQKAKNEAEQEKFEKREALKNHQAALAEKEKYEHMMDQAKKHGDTSLMNHFRPKYEQAVNDEKELAAIAEKESREADEYIARVQKLKEDERMYEEARVEAEKTREKEMQEFDVAVAEAAAAEKEEIQKYREVHAKKKIATQEQEEAERAAAVFAERSRLAEESKILVGGVLKLDVTLATGLRDGTNDPYAIINLQSNHKGQRKAYEFRTQAAVCTENPYWDESLDLSAVEGVPEQITFQVYDEENSELLGTTDPVSFNLSDSVEYTVSSVDLKGEDAEGSIQFAYSFAAQFEA